MRRRFIGLALVATTLLAACAQSFFFAGQKYSERSAAEAVRIERFAKVVADLARRERSFDPGVRFVIPGRDLVENLLRTRYGSFYDVFSGEQRAYLRELGFAEFQLVIELVKKRNIFSRIEVVELPGHDQTSHVAPRPGEVAIYYYAADRASRSWYYRSERTPVTPLHVDSGNPEFAARVRYMIDSIEALAAGE